MGRIDRVYGITGENVAAGQIRLNKNTQRLVKIAYFKYEETQNDVTIILWRVRDVLSGRYENVKRRHLGDKIFNEMEILAWASK